MNRLFTVFALLVFAAGNILAQSSFTTGQIAVNLSNFGRVRILNADNTTQQIDRSSFLVGKSATAVFDYLQDAEIVESSKTVTPTISNFELYNHINSTYSNLPPKVSAKIHVYGWSNQGYVLVKLIVKNEETAAFSAFLGMEIIPKIDNVYGNEICKYNHDTEILTTYKTGGSYVGYNLISEETHAVRLVDWVEGYGTDSAYWNWFNRTTHDTSLTTGPDGAVAFFGQNGVDVAPGQTTTMWVVIAKGATENAMLINMANGAAKYASILTDLNDPHSPYQYTLEQNYPNPFNPSSTLRYSLEKPGYVTLTVYNVLGKEVARLVDGVQEAGKHSINFSSAGLSSGVYYYRINSGNFNATRKMTILK